MSVSAPILEELHRIHRQLSDLRERLSGGPKQVRIREGNVSRLEAEQAKARDEHKAARMTVDQKQLLLKSAETKIQDRRTQLNQCNTNREYQTMLEQIAADEMAKACWKTRSSKRWTRSSGPSWWSSRRKPTWPRGKPS